jgi:hypothetical protein
MEKVARFAAQTAGLITLLSFVAPQAVAGNPETEPLLNIFFAELKLAKNRRAAFIF